MKIKDDVSNFYLLNHLALQMSSLEGNIPGPMAMALSILALIILFGLSKMFFVILSSHEEHTCVHLRRLAMDVIIIILLKTRSGKLSQLGWSPISTIFSSIGLSTMAMLTFSSPTSTISSSSSMVLRSITSIYFPWPQKSWCRLAALLRIGKLMTPTYRWFSPFIPAKPGRVIRSRGLTRGHKENIISQISKFESQK